MKQGFRSIKGTFDILPESYEMEGSPVASSAAWRYVEQTIREVLGRFHFAEIRTPLLEDIGLFERGIGASTDIVSKEMFAIPRLRETYVLRPEVTASVMRAHMQHRLEQRGGAQRLFYIGPCFRAERPQKGRFRQFHQFGAEIIGSEDARADAEVIAAMWAVYLAFGIRDGRLRINSLGNAESRARYRARLTEYLQGHTASLSETSRQRLASNPLRILDTKDEGERRLLEGAPLLSTFLDADDASHYDGVKTLLVDLGIPFEEDPLLVRGLDYYSRTAFELESDDLGAQSALAGGGRYDGLAEVIGSPATIPGVGFAAGIERLFLALAARGGLLPEEAKPDVFFVALGPEAERWVFSEAQRFRAAGLRVAFDLKGRSMKAQMKEADRQAAPLAVIVGEREVDQSRAQVKTMAAGTQEEVDFERLLDHLQSGLLGIREGKIPPDVSRDPSRP